MPRAMRRPTRAAALALALALSVPGCCRFARRGDAPPPAPAPASEEEPMTQPEIPAAPRGDSLRPELVQATLDNGLQVYMIEDHSAPLVSYQVWFRVGAANEQELLEGTDHGNTGLSHFFEHMMFRGTEKHADFFDQVYSLGGQLNAFTWHDETVYWEKVPSQHLETIISMEADRLEHMKIDFLNLEPEREVVKSERLLRTVNKAEGQAWEKLQARVFTQHPYHWKTIGWLPDLNAVTVEEAQAYHDVFYAPNNAFVLVAGDHDPATTLEWIKSYYGHLPAKELPSAEFPQEPRQEAERRDRVLKASDPQVVMWGFRAPAVTSRDYAALEVIDHILTAGKSSRLQSKLVYADTPRLARLYAYLFPMRDPYLYVWGANLLPDMRTHELEAAFDAEVRDLVANGVTEAELRRAVAGLRSDIVRQNLSSHEKAQFIGFSLRSTDDPYAGFDRIELYGQITSADVQRVAAEWLRPGNRTWVPVVDPGRLTRLVETVVAASPALPAQVADVGRAAAALVLARQELDAARSDQREEARALGLLELRAQRAAEGADEATRQAISQYMADNEKGFAKRKARLDVGRAEIAAAEQANAAAATKLAEQLRALRRARFDATRPPGVFLSSLAEHVLKPDATPVDAEVGLNDPALLPFRVAYHAALAWVFDARGQAPMATLHGARAVHLADKAREAGTLEDPALLRVLDEAHAVAWDLRVTGGPGGGPVRTAPAGSTGRPGGGR